MSKRIVMIVGSIILLGALALGGTLFYISKKINPKELKQTLIQAIEGNIIGSEAQISELDYSLGTKVSFEIKGLEILEKTKKLKIVNLKEVHVDISLFAILMGGGNIDVKILSPYVNVYKNSSGQINWQSYLKKENVEKKEVANKKSKDSSDSKLEVPSFVENSKLNFRILDFVLDYKDKEQSSFKFKKILFKNLNLKKTTAYEIVSNINYKIDKKQKFTSQISLVGELALNKLLSKENFEATTYLDIKNSTLTGSEFKIPNLSSEIKLKLKKNSDLLADFFIKSKSLVDSKMKIELTEKELDLDILNFDLQLVKTFEALSLKIENLSLNDAILKLSGNVKFGLKSSKLVSSLNLQLNKPLLYKYEGHEITLDALAKYNANKLFLKTSSELFSGEMDLSANTGLDLMNPPTSLESLEPIVANLNVKNIKLPKSFFPEDNQKEAKKAVGSKVLVKEEQSIDLPNFPVSTLRINASNIGIKEIKMGVKSTIRTSAKRVSSNNTKVFLDKSKSSLSFTTNLNKSIDTDFNLRSERLNLKSFSSFMPVKFKELSGMVNATASGNVRLSKTMSYNILADVKSTNGSVKGLNLKKIIEGLLGKLAKHIPKKKVKLTESYDELSTKVRATDKSITVNNFSMIGKNKSLNLDLAGVVSMLDRPSELTGNLSVRDLAADLNKSTGSDQIPLRLKGIGFALSPEFSYTSKRLVKKAAKAQVKKIKNKLKDDLKKKAKELFKGFKL